MNTPLTDKELIQEALNTEKHLGLVYHYATQESSNEPLHCELKTLMDEILSKQNDTYKLMQTKGFYKIEQIQQAEIDKVKNKFAQAAQKASSNQ